MKSKILALSAISAGFIAICLTIGAYIEFTDIFAVILASVFIVLPLYLKSIKGSVLSSIAGVTIAFLCSGFNFYSLVFPAFITFFGIYPIIKTIFIDRKVNKILAYFIGLIWFVAVAYGVFFFYFYLVLNGVLTDLPLWIINNIYWLIAPVAIIFYVVYERFIVAVNIVANKYLKKIIK